MKYALKTILSVIVWTVVAVLLFLSVNGFVQRFSAKKGVGLFGIGYAVVVSGSMEPTLQVNDMIVYQELSDDEYKIGDVIVYLDPKDEDRLITHRIVEISGDTLVTLGDANHGIRDERITFRDVRGKVAYFFPKVGALMQFVKTPVGIIVFGAVFMLLAGLAVLDTVLDARGRKVTKNGGS